MRHPILSTGLPSGRRRMALPVTPVATSVVLTRRGRGASQAPAGDAMRRLVLPRLNVRNCLVKCMGLSGDYRGHVIVSKPLALSGLTRKVFGSY